MHQNTDGIWSFADKGKATKRLAQRDGESLMILKCIQLTEDQTVGKDTAQQVSSKQRLKVASSKTRERVMTVSWIKPVTDCKWFFFLIKHKVFFFWFFFTSYSFPLPLTAKLKKLYWKNWMLTLAEEQCCAFIGLINSFLTKWNAWTLSKFNSLYEIQRFILPNVKKALHFHF